MKDHQLGYPPVLKALFFWDRFEGYDILNISDDYPLGVPDRVLAEIEAYPNPFARETLADLLPTADLCCTERDHAGIERRGYVQKARIRDACRALAGSLEVFYPVRLYSHGNEETADA